VTSFIVEEGARMFEGSRNAADRLFVKARVPVVRSLWNRRGLDADMRGKSLNSR